MSKAIKIESNSQLFHLLTLFKEVFKLVVFSLLSAAILSACQGQSTSKAKDAQQVSPAKLSSDQDHTQDKTEKACKRVGERCRLRPGVLGICSPSSPQNEALAPWVSASSTKRLHCTPQH